MKLGTIARAGLAAAGLALLAGCASSPGSTPTPDPEETEIAVTDLAGEWLLVKGSDADGAMGLDLITVTLAIQQDGAVSGQGPCNSYTGGLEQDGASVTFGPLASTLMACEEEAKTEIESRYLAALEAVDTSKLGADTLTLTGPDVSLQYDLTSEMTTQ
jgi:heat shock protein HslJ